MGASTGCRGAPACVSTPAMLLLLLVLLLLRLLVLLLLLLLRQPVWAARFGRADGGTEGSVAGAGAGAACSFGEKESLRNKIRR